MTAKIKCSNCGAEISNLNFSWGSKQLWLIIPIMLLGFLPLAKLLWFKGDATKELKISDVQKRPNGSYIEIVGLITNTGTHDWSSVTIKAEFFDASGNFIDESQENLRSDIAGGAKEHFKISVKNPTKEGTGPDAKMELKISGGYASPF